MLPTGERRAWLDDGGTTAHPVFFQRSAGRIRCKFSFLAIGAGLTGIRKAFKRHPMLAVLTVRLSKEEQGILAKRSKRAGMKKAGLPNRDS